ncbi:N-acetylmuramoyl-L-alanine amidase [Oikeobacillus pervagus]|nr:N-acetylmuramoyl-L-alanine amidase [Oikeobacillus pervagus]
MKMMLDAGHGYSTPGKRSPDGFREYEFNHAVANYAKDFLKQYKDITIYFAHSDQRDVPLIERTNLANHLGVDIYIAIHANAYGSSWNGAEGIETYVYPSRPSEAVALANRIQRNIVIATGRKDRGVKTADFHVLRETNMTAVLIEGGFMTNKEEANLLRSASYQKAVAEAIVKAVAEQYHLQKKENQPESPTAPPTQTSYYRVQVGAFHNKENALSLVKKLKEKGFEAYIPEKTSASNLYQVQAGAFYNKENAQDLVDQLKKIGIESFIHLD